MSPIVTGNRSPPGLRRSSATIASEKSMPCTSTPRAASGRATRPVPIASSRAGPSPASSCSRSTVGPSTWGSNMCAEPASYVGATRSSKGLGSRWSIAYAVTAPPCPSSSHARERFSVSLRSQLAQEGEEHRVRAVDVRPELDVRPLAEAQELVPVRVDEQRSSIDELDVVATLEDVGDHEACLVEVRAARGVADEPAGRGRVDAGHQQLTLQAREGRHVTGRAPPPRLGAPTQRPETGARSVDEHAAETARLDLAELAPVTVADLETRVSVTSGHSRRSQRLPYEIGTVLTDLVGHEGNPTLDGKGCQEACLASRSGAEVEPALVPCRVTLDCRGGEGEDQQLRALVLRGGAAVAHGRDGTGVTLGQGRPDGAEPRTLGTGFLELVERDEPGPRDERHLRRVVVALEERGQGLLDVARPCGSVSDERSPEGLGDPDRMRGAQGEAFDGVVDTRGDEVGPRVRVPLADASHDGVDEAGRPGAVDLPGQSHGLVDRCVAGHAHAEQLVRAEPQGVEHVGIDLVDGATCSRHDDRIVEPGESRRAVDQLSGESGVSAADSLVAQQLRQREVGVGAVRDLTHRGIGRESWRIGATGTLGRSLPRTVSGRALTCGWSLTLSPPPVAPRATSVSAASSLVTHRRPALLPRYACHEPSPPPASASCRVAAPCPGARAPFRCRRRRPSS